MSRSILFWTLLAGATMGSLPGAPEPCACGLDLQYSVSLARRSEHLCQVEMRIAGVNHSHLDLALPAWNNLYQLRDFVRNLGDLSARDGAGNPLEVRRTGSHRWRIGTSGVALIRLGYQVFADEPGDFYSQIDQEHAFLNGANIFVYLEGHRRLPLRVDFQDLDPQWRIATGLDRDGSGQGFRARDYDHLIDCPFEISAFQDLSFRSRGVEFQIVYHGSVEEPEKFRSTLEPLVETSFQLMRDVPLKRYVFIFHFTGVKRGGGMEHRNSTAVNMPPAREPNTAARNYLGIAGVSAHEFFHLWNVKRIRPHSFIEPDWTRPIPTPALWFIEGFSSYYGSLIPLRSGLYTPTRFLGSIAGRIRGIESRSSHRIMSVEEVSSGAWRYPEPSYLLPENSYSYYSKGGVLAFLADLRIRSETSGDRSLDDVMRFLNWFYAKPGKGFDPQDLPRVFSTVCECDFNEFFQNYVSGTEPLPYQEYLALAGLELVRGERTATDFGFEATSNHGEPRIVARIDDGSLAEKAGLRLGDVVLSNYRPTEAGEEVSLKIMREGKDQELGFKTGKKQTLTIKIRILEDPSPAQLRVRRGLLDRASIDGCKSKTD